MPFFFFVFVFLAMRGGISQCSCRYAKANNKYMEDFDAEQPSSYLMYLDVNNLYGYAMMDYLPLNGYKWSNNTPINTILRTPDNNVIGYFVEVNLEYPKELHDLHNDYPMCAEHDYVNDTKIKKLILNLSDKINYVLHYRTLKMVVHYGLKIVSVGRVLEFHQSRWLKPFIDLNTCERTKAKNEFEKNLYKLMSNAIYGKTLENVRERVDVSIINQWGGRYGARHLIARANFKKCVILSKDLVAIELFRTNVVMNKPIAIGVSVLELSKLCMYDFHYGFMRPKFDTNAELLYTDTDSFIYNIFCDDFYQVIKENAEKFDTSDYSRDNPFDIRLLNKKVPGLMKDENNGKIMTEFVGLRSKMYSIRLEHKDHVKKSKGVKKNVVSKKLTFDSFLKCLRTGTAMQEKQCTILSRKHKVFSIEQTKNVLDPFDDKRYIMKDKIHTLAWGHHSLDN